MNFYKKFIYGCLACVGLLLSITDRLHADDNVPYEVRYADGRGFSDRRNKTTYGPSSQLLPDSDQSAAIRRDIIKLEPTLTVEMLYRMPLPEENHRRRLLFIARRLSDVRSLKGIRYYSWRQQDVITLISDIGLVPEAGSYNILPNPFIVSLPFRNDFIMYQQDNLFGNGWYNLNFSATPNSIRLSLRNNGTLWYGLIPLIGDNSLHIDILVIREDNDLLFYASSRTSISSFMGIDSIITSISGPFTSRLKAMQRWFYAQIYQN